MPDDGKLDTRGLKGVIPYIGMDGEAGEAAAFYIHAFGARDLGRIPGEGGPERLMHCQIEINGGALMMTDMHAPDAPAVKPQGFHLQLVVADGQAWWDRAVEAGCTVMVPFQTMFWGDRWGMFSDPYGLLWAINEPAAPSDA